LTYLLKDSLYSLSDWIVSLLIEQSYKRNTPICHSRRTGQPFNIVREQFLLVLLKKKIVSQALMHRIFALGDVFSDPSKAGGEPSPVPLGTFEEFLGRRGIAQILE
jgi:hypothetical protein